MKTFKLSVTLSVFILLIFCCKEKQEYAKLKFQFGDRGINVPMKINDSLYYFLWDSGASLSSISESVITENNLTTTNKYTNVKSLSNYATVSKYKLHSVKSKIGELNINSTFYKYDSNLIGNSIITKYYWLFNFADTTVEISNIPILDVNDSIKSLKFQFKKRGFPIVKTDLNGETFDLLFDTGHDLFEDFAIQTHEDSTLFNYLKTCEKSAVFGTTVNTAALTAVGAAEKTILILGHLSVNNVVVTNVLKKKMIASSEFNQFYKDLPFSGVITFRFVSRFKQMYYNPKEGEIHLIYN